MVLIPVFVSLLFYQRFVLALGVFVLAGITDGLDGLLARRFNQKSQLGTILDPIADKLLISAALISLDLRQNFVLRAGSARVIWQSAQDAWSGASCSIFSFVRVSAMRSDCH
jgi:phosphatidylglycerophosphate synthase